MLNLSSTFSISTFLGAKLVIYSNGLCLILKEISSNFDQVGPDVYLKFDGKPCLKSKKSWISALNYEKQNDEQIKLLWADSNSHQLFTGYLDLKNQEIFSIRSHRLPKASFIRNIATDAYSDTVYLAFSQLGLIINYDLKKETSFTVYEAKKGEKIGAMIYDNLSSNLMWIMDQQYLCQKQAKLPANEFHCSVFFTDNSTKLQALTIDSKENVIYIFSQNGKIVQYDLKANHTTLISDNLLLNDKYSSALFYTAKAVISNDWLKFLTSDVYHQSFRISSYNLIEKEGRINYLMDLNNSRMLFVDSPNIYDFIMLDKKSYPSSPSTSPASRFIPSLLPEVTTIRNYLAITIGSLYKNNYNQLEYETDDVTKSKTSTPYGYSLGYLFWLFFGLAIGILIAATILLISVYPFLRRLSSPYNYDAKSLVESLTHEKYLK